MPSTYAHYRFGCHVIEKLPNGLKNIANNYRELFDIGTHGPDILFYFEPYHKHPISDLGFNMHELPASDFFKKTRKLYAKRVDEKQAMIAYLLGFVSHYCLDTIAHPYVEAKEHYANISHTEIEVEYDRHLLIEDNQDPFKYDLVQHIKANKFNANIIKTFFPEIDENIALDCLKSMIFYIHLLQAPNNFKRNSLYSALKVLGKYDSLHDQIISKNPNPICLDSNMRLDKLTLKASELYLELAPNLFAYLNGQSDLDPRFNNTFGAGDNWQSIPVYDIDKEKEYEI